MSRWSAISAPPLLGGSAILGAAIFTPFVGVAHFLMVNDVVVEYLYRFVRYVDEVDASGAAKGPDLPSVSAGVG